MTKGPSSTKWSQVIGGLKTIRAAIEQRKQHLDDRPGKSILHAREQASCRVVLLTTDE